MKEIKRLLFNYDMGRGAYVITVLSESKRCRYLVSQSIFRSIHPEVINFYENHSMVKLVEYFAERDIDHDMFEGVVSFQDIMRCYDALCNTTTNLYEYDFTEEFPDWAKLKILI